MAATGSAQVRRILQVAVILLAITILEFIIAFTVESGTFKVVVFIVLTLVKAFYIIADFMHLSHETRGLIIGLVSPLPLILLLTYILLYEGSAIAAFFGS